ncbi:DUF4435 domain-containing protein [Daejeonella oryzae]|uniref:DUF4435 domain-containing protein n=1 Tax=Daejeonella oryzae TaxID=1122943 RepID=UPI00040D1F78|nr:DUF4435 domain-containing protein [Daejeonella oryzae]
MITLEESIPSKNWNYIIAEDIFYYQFNEIAFYIEDEDQENFFFCILKNLFPEIKIEKIFPLNGKENVIAESKDNIDNKKKVYIVDKDFDDILNKKILRDNLFYLERYSIENYLIEKDSIIEYIISEKPKLKRSKIADDFNLDLSISKISNVLRELIYLHLVVQKICPRLKNITLNHERFFDFNNGNFQSKNDQMLIYKNAINNELLQIDRRLTLNGQLNKIKRNINIDNNELSVIHIPGKYLIKMLKQLIESLFGLVSRNTDSYCYNIAKNCNFQSLNSLKIQINEYIK